MARLRKDANKEAKRAENTRRGENRRKKVNFYFINQIGISENYNQKNFAHHDCAPRRRWWVAALR